MIGLSNDHILEYVAGSASLGFDGKGYWWQLLWRLAGKLKPELFTIVLKTITKKKRAGNSKLYWPYGTVKHIEFEGKQGIVNAKGLGNPGIEKWCTKYASRIDWEEANLIASIYAENKEELCELTTAFNKYPFKAIEINALCPNVAAPRIIDTEFVVKACEAVYEVSKHPILLKLTTMHDYQEIVEQTFCIVEAIEINSVPWSWSMIFPNTKSPMEKYGGGAVSGQLAQEITWKMVKEIAELQLTPVIAPSIWKYEDIAKVRKLGAQAISMCARFHNPE
ncbi:MAG: hypothetical protein KAS87_00885, partial [Candidatus Omnitrophica bacterium]|nr:hypothetical protein [Candidatus Omnitrophota bacterium]